MRRDVPSPRAGVPEIPGTLLQDIELGRCIAFVGAGFSAAAGLPGWKDLLLRMAEDLPADLPARAEVQAMLAVEKPDAADLDRAAQRLEDAAGRGPLIESLRSALSLQRRGQNPQMQARLRHLREIPFRAIVTTNFDPLLQGQTLSPEAYHQVLRADPWRPWEQAFRGDERGPVTVKLHGDLECADPGRTIVLTRRDYRRLLYEEPGYQTFVRTLFATHTVLFLGFSFQDNYLNEIRSEVMSLFARDPEASSASRRPLAYALLAEQSNVAVELYRRHEGTQILSYSAADRHVAFDVWLERLWEATAVLPRLRERIGDRRFVWLDRHHAQNNAAGEAFLHAVCGTRDRLRVVSTPAEALSALETFDPDAIITHWGEGDAELDGVTTSNAECLLSLLRRRSGGRPVVVFTQERDLERRRAAALRLGAFDVCVRWSDLFAAIERIWAAPR